MTRRQTIRSLARTTRGARPQRVTVMRVCVVDHVTAGGSTDGRAAAFVTYGGDVFPAPYNANYTPAAGDQVAVLFTDGSPVIAFRIVGFPTF